MLLDLALQYVARGWHVFPCWPRTKKPMTAHGWHDATTDAEQIRAWWAQKPDANIAIACGPSNLAVLDIDHGLTLEDGSMRPGGISAFIPHAANIDVLTRTFTYAVRTGRRPEFGIQIYFEGTIPDVGLWKLHGCEGQVKSAGGYVMAAGSIHPDSGLAYEVFLDSPLQPVPDYLRSLKPERPKVDDGATAITSNRNVALTSIAGKLRNAGLSAAALEVALLQVNEDRCDPMLDEEEVKRIAANASKWELPKDGPAVTIGGREPAESPVVTDWRELFHTRDEVYNAPPISFLIDKFLQREGITAIAAPVRERKTFIVLNTVRSLLTGEPLFGKFEVTKKPSRVLYLCPEVSLGPFSDRLKHLGLEKYVGETLFLRTLSSALPLRLTDSNLLPALPGSVVVLDTAIRFLEGKENDSADIRAFADQLFAIMRAGAESIIMVHHSPKGDRDLMTLENALRGSGDLGAFLVSCWGTRLQEPDKPYQSLSFLTNLKQRDFESEDFEVSCDPDGLMRYLPRANGGKAVLQARNRGNSANRDGQDDAALSLIREDLELSGVKMSAHLKENGIKRSPDWVNRKRAEIRSSGTTVTSAQNLIPVTREL